MATVTVEVPDDAFSALRRSPKEFAEDMRLAAVIQWYHQRLISQSKAAAIAGLSRRDFLMALFHAKVEASQVDIEEMKEDVERDIQRVVNASPLIFLTEVGLLEVLRQPGVPVLVPDVVLNEIGGLGPNDPTIQAVQQSPWMQIVLTPTIPDAVLVWDLDAGESAVLAVALGEPDSMAILDDQAARRCANVLNIQSQGTLGLVLVAKQQGPVPFVRPVLEQLKQAGMYLSDRLADQVLAAAGESP